MAVFDDLFSHDSWSLDVRTLGIALVAIAAGFGLGRLAEAILRRIAGRLAPRSLRRNAVAAFDRPAGWALRLTGIWIALRTMPLGEVEAVDLASLANHLMEAAVVGLAAWLGTRLVQAAADAWQRRAAATEDTFDDQLVPIARQATKAFLVVVAVVMIVQNLGYSAASLLTGLGLGGAALAFAAKDTVANFFGSIVIFVDRPFQLGDWIEAGDVEGTVEEVGIRVTQIRTFANSLLTVPNARFTSTPINNWSRMRKRRIKLDVGLSYATTPPQMRAAVAAIRACIEADERMDQEFYLVNFHAFSASSLDIFVYCFTRTTNWAEYMQVREDFLMTVMERLAELELSIAFPTQTVHLQGQLAATMTASPKDPPQAMLRDAPS